MRRASKVDVNQPEIVRKLRALGLTVASTAAVGQGFPDIAVGYKGRNYLFEIKDPGKPPSARTLTPHEASFHVEWLGQVCIIMGYEDALRAMNWNKP